KVGDGSVRLGTSEIASAAWSDRVNRSLWRGHCVMKRIRIVHEKQYHYNQPVKIRPHPALLRPPQGPDVHISRSRLSVAPAAAVRWLRDIYGNSIAILTFEESSQRLSVAGEVDVELYDDNPIECLIEPTAREFPFQYLPEEQVELVVYCL